MAGTTYNYEQAGNSKDEFNMTSWLNQLKYIWGLWKKSNGVTRTLHEYFDVAQNPYESVLYILQNCEDFKQAKPNSLTYTVIEEFSSWVKNREIYLSHLLASDIKLRAFYLVTQLHNMTLVKMMCTAYKMVDENHIFVDPIKHLLERKLYKESCQVASFLHLHDYFNIYDFLIPLVFQDKLTVLEEFLSGSISHQTELVAFLDSLLGHRNMGNEVDSIISVYDIPDVKRAKLYHKPVSKFVGRLMNMYNLPRDLTPNLNRKRNEGALQFLVYKRYVQHTLGRDSFREMVLEATASNSSLQREVVSAVNTAGDVQEALYWVQQFGIPKTDVPTRVRELMDANLGGQTYGEVEENWDDNPGIEFHSLSLPDSHIIVVDTPIKFREFLQEVSCAIIVGIDSEWKPHFGTRKNALALIQVATHNKVYILDIVHLGCNEQCSWEEAGKILFGNETITKLGFGVNTDLNLMLQCLPGLGNTVQNQNGYLDLVSLWHRLSKEFKFNFPYGAEEGGESLAYLVELSLGKRLDKSDQFSNWERRPLRIGQLRYAALDAFCLLEVFDVLKQCSDKQDIPFQEVCIELMSKIKPNTKKSSKSRKRNKVDAPVEVVRPFSSPLTASNLRVVCDRGLEGLGQQLRKVGVDTLTVSPNDHHDRVIQIAKKEDRVVVVRGRSTFAKISQHVPRGHCYPVSSESTHDQLREVLIHFNVQIRKEDIFSRCKLCNGATFTKISQSTMKIIYSTPQSTVYSVDYEQDNNDSCTGFSSESDGFSDDGAPPPPSSKVAIDENPNYARTPDWVENIDVNSCRTKRGALIQMKVVPPECINSITEFNICDLCGRVYWDGSHFERFVNGKLKDIICQ